MAEQQAARCAVCRRPTLRTDATRLPLRCHNPADPLWALNEAVVHTACLKTSGVGRLWIRTLEHVNARLRGWPPTCDACGTRILGPEQVFGLVGFVSSEPTSPAYGFGGVCVHRNCVRVWERRREFAAALRRVETDIAGCRHCAVPEFLAELRKWVEFLERERDVDATPK